METTGKRLKEARLKKGLKQKEVANKLDLDVSTILKYESGERKLSFGTVSKLAKLYGLSVEYFLFGQEEPEIGASFRVRENKSDNDLEVEEWVDNFIRDLYQVMNM